MTEDLSAEWNRRRVLKATGVAGATAGLAGVGSAGSFGRPGAADVGAADEECGPNSETTFFEDSIATGESNAYAYSVGELDEVCEVEVALLTTFPPDEADFDLYLTLDGRTPTPDDYDRASRESSSNEGIVLDDEVESGDDLGLLVRAYEGEGDYSLVVEEVGSKECGADVAVEYARGSLDESADVVHTFDRELDSECPVEVTFATVVEDGAVFDLYLDFEGELPSPDDHDRHLRASEGGESIQVEGDEVDDDEAVGALVVADEVGGRYEIEFKEHSDERVGPSATFQVVTDDPTEDETLSLDASGSSANVGRSIESYEWDYQRQSFFFGDRGSGTGEQFSFTPDHDGHYQISLRVTDEKGRADTAHATVGVEDDGSWWPF